MNASIPRKAPILLIAVAAMGYFVDIYDLVLFNVVKKESLVEIMRGATASEITDTGIFLFNMQMFGMLIGGILWGIWGDKRGRVSVLFGSILLYSLANLLNAFVTSIPAYALIRIIAGIGLAGELGAGITLVSETMSREKRGYGTLIIVSFGALGAVVAALVGAKGETVGRLLSAVFGGEFSNWQVAYIVGGTLGLLLLLLRVGTIESGMFKRMQQSPAERGNLLWLFTNRARLWRYLCCIFIGLPVWYVVGLLVANSEEVFAPELGVQGAIKNGEAVKYAYLGLCVGDVISGLLSQWWKSRRKVVFLYLLFCLALTLYFLFGVRNVTPEYYYFLTFLMGTAAGYWAIFVIIAAEQFGTNIRSTVTTTVPNFVRGSVPLITSAFGFLTASSVGNLQSALWVGLLCFGLAAYATYCVRETFSRDLDFVET